MDGDKRNYWQGDSSGLVNRGEAPDGLAEEFEPIHWEASEYVHHEKNSIWLIALAGITIALAAVFYVLIRSITFVVLTVVMGFATGFFAVRPPRTIAYELSEHGLKIDGKLYAPQDFRAFGVVEEGPFSSIVLLPTKRFAPLITVYFPPEQGENIVDILGSEIPMEQIRLDFVDNLVRKLRF